MSTFAGSSIYDATNTFLVKSFKFLMPIIRKFQQQQYVIVFYNFFINT
jgi:hypothetical protein